MVIVVPTFAICNDRHPPKVFAIVGSLIVSVSPDVTGRVDNPGAVEGGPAKEARTSRLHHLGYENVSVRHEDGDHGWESKSPCDIIIVAAAPDHIPQPLVDQLAAGGKLVIPVGAYFHNCWSLKGPGRIINPEVCGARCLRTHDRRDTTTTLAGFRPTPANPVKPFYTHARRRR